MNEKKSTILSIVKKYRTHREVEKLVNKYREASAVYSGVDSTKRYFQEIGQYRLLDAEDEQHLFTRIELGLQKLLISGEDIDALSYSPTDDLEQSLINLTAAYMVIINTNLRLVISIAKKYALYTKSMELQDLIQEGTEGLSRAVTGFDIGRGLKFSTYATWWVRQLIARAVSDKERLIRVPTYAHDLWLKIMAISKEYKTDFGEEPTVEYLALATDTKEETVKTLLLRGANNISSLDAPLKGGRNASKTGSTSTLAEVLDYLPGAELSDIDKATLDITQKETINVIIEDAGLDVRARFIIALRFGLNLPTLQGRLIGDIKCDDFLTYDHSLTLDEVGMILGLTRERVRQIESNAIEKLSVSAQKSGIELSDIL